MFSIYLLVDPKTKQIRYVGQTKQKLNRRLYQHIIKCSSPSQKQRYVNHWIAGLLKAGRRPQIRFVCMRSTRKEINVAEKSVIARLLLNNHKLCNLTSGGDGCYEMSRQTRQRMSTAHKGDKNHFYGRRHTDETKRKISNTLKGRKLPKEHRQNISKGIRGVKNGFYGRHHSKETKRRLAAYHAKTYTFRDPKGNIVTITNLKQFCRENGLNLGAMWCLTNPLYPRKSHKGWTRYMSPSLA